MIADLPDDDRAEAGLEVPQHGLALEHPDTTAEDQARARAASVLEAARLDLMSGDLHPNALRARLGDKLGAAQTERTPRASPAGVLERWASDGPLVHEPTGIDRLDDVTGGGPVYGERWFIMGAPDAGKTALLVQIAHSFAMRNIAVGLLAVDEEPSDMLTRLAQRVGFERVACERREPGALAKLYRLLGQLPILFFGADWTIEAAGNDLAAFAAERGSRALFCVDSLQTVQCDAELERELATPQAIDKRAKAVRAMATKHRMITLATSEMARAAYRSKAAREDIDPMAAGKWSGAIEYQAKVLIALRSVARAPDTIEVELPKNKHKKSADDGRKFYLAIDRASQKLTETDAPPKAEKESEGPDDETKEKLHESKLEEAAHKLVTELVRRAAKGIEIKGQQELRRLIVGRNDFRQDVISYALAEGLIEGGRGKPFRKRHVAGDEEDDG